MAELPIHAVLPDLLAALATSPNAVLVAPPGAGKTTTVAPALLDQPWCTGQILLLSPRRLAARAAAERIAELAGESVGQTIGYATRMDSKTSAATRVLVLTEGIFVNRIQADPELAGVSAVLFDEVHERSLDSDFGLALALEAQGAFRSDLRLLAMSATLDGARFSALMGDAPVLNSEGRSHPLALRHLGRRGEQRLEDAMAQAIRIALREEAGDVLAFLPGVGEIARTQERLANLGDVIVVLPLHGTLTPPEQRAAIRRDPQGRRKVILATSIAETSLTIDGVRIVVDSGMARRARYDPLAATTRLVTERASQAAATQRAGRAARQGPGVAYRLWEEAATGGLPRFDPPEIVDSDLAPLVLQCAAWGENDPLRLNWLDPPPAPLLAEARKRLQALDALDATGAITPNGRAIAALPLPPHLAHMLLCGARAGCAMLAAEIALLLQERGLGGQGEDLDARLARWRSDRGERASKSRKLAQRWAQLAERQIANPNSSDLPPAILLALAFPDRVAKRRDAGGEAWASAGGRSFRLDTASSLITAQWLAIGEVQGKAADARILSAMALDPADVETHLAARIERVSRCSFALAERRAEARLERRLGAIRLASGPDPSPSPDALCAALIGGVREHGLDLFGWGDKALALRQRARFAGIAVLEDAALLDSLDDWLAPLLAGHRSLGAVGPGPLHTALQGLLGWDAAQTVDRIAPPEFTSPAGTRHAIDYSATAGPTVELRVQALYGLDVHPVVGRDHIPLVLSLTSPAGRPIQTTRDLPGFWRGSWRDVAKDMRGRYPRHHWPDAPWEAQASLATKKRQGI
ncbi:ATP-dependent helicase [Blastomonas sp. AAP25]|uniref:ATP-dependent helicase HrpB n=1 Tax=Blastomonas sp. AAP25 TaxID=1523416 RepID=UPI0006B8D928|nr:ATP-dependent helicase HrpB [Blastomonas sp. AAP25]KPF76207.1 ATP-dependent helicase [Blastomonas sp. AAP25]